MKQSPLIEVSDLLKIHKQSDVIIFDVSNSPNARKNFETEHLEGAFFIDLNTELADIKADLSKGGRHPLPEIKSFVSTLSKLGIEPSKKIVIYDDTNGSNAAARFWWMLRSIGHENVQVLNGGLNEAKKNDFPLSSTILNPTPTNYLYPVDEWIFPIVEMSTVEQVVKDPNYRVIDVRSKERFDGLTEPIDLVAGHIPGAINVPFTENLDENGLFLFSDFLKEKYEKIIDSIPTNHIIVHCGSGVTACHTLLAFDYAGLPIPQLYIGSWSEWSRNFNQINFP
jgi:thiosulfate/3-mercaptopyruvate sulfurtransferase